MELLERMVQKGGVKSLVTLITKSPDSDAQRFAALALANAASAGEAIANLMKSNCDSDVNPILVI